MLREKPLCTKGTGLAVPLNPVPTTALAAEVAEVRFSIPTGQSHLAPDLENLLPFRQQPINRPTRF